MKKWPLIVAALYGLILAVLFYPVAAIAFVKHAELKPTWLLDLMKYWGFWLIIGVLALSQFALLRVPVAVAHRRPVKQRSVWITVIAAAFMMGLVVSGASLSVWEFITKDVELPMKDKHWSITLVIMVMIWVAWAIYFHWATKSAGPEIQMGKLKRFLWTGSILDLLVAIPTHIVARHRDYCCAGFLTFIGLTCGISVMLFAFGPAVYFLFVDRWRRLHPKEAEALGIAPSKEACAAAAARHHVHWMRNYAVIVAALYPLVCSGAVWLLSKIAVTHSMRAGARGFAESQDEWGLWPIIIPMVLAQYLFLRVPVTLACRQTVQVGSRWGTVLAASFMMGVIVLGAGMSITEVLYGGFLDPESRQGRGVSIDLMLISWVCCAIYFNVVLHSSSLDRAMNRLRSFLLVGSIIELLVATLMHVVVSQREYHYVGGMTFMGLIFGVAGVIFAVGSTVHGHLAERWRRLHPEG